MTEADLTEAEKTAMRSERSDVLMPPASSGSPAETTITPDTTGNSSSTSNPSASSPLLPSGNYDRHSKVSEEFLKQHRKSPAEILRRLHRIHKNLGHPSSKTVC